MAFHGIPALAVFAILLAAPLLAATAAEPNDSTPCGALSGVLDVETPNRERILPFQVYMLTTLRRLDHSHTARGEPEVLAPLAGSQITNLLAFIAAHCHNNPKMSIYNATSEVYGGLQELQTREELAR
jgi:hypothetical protein